MTARDDYIAAITAAGDTYAQSAASDAATQQQATDQAIIDALNTQIADDTGTISADKSLIADLQAQVDTLTPPSITEFKDFSAPNTCGMWVASGSLVGGGKTPDKTVYRMTPRTSTKSAPTSGTNPYRLIRTGGMTAGEALQNPEIANFTLQGTDQGHLYGGCQLGYSNGAHVHDVIVTGIPGSSSSPPGETFSLELWHSNNSLVEDCTVDGLNVAASLFGLNDVTNCTLNRIAAHHAKCGMGITFWQCGGKITMTDADLSNNRKAINVEQALDHSVYRFVRPNITGSSINPPISFNAAFTDGRTADISLYVEDPVVDAWPLRVAVAPLGATASNASRGINAVDWKNIHLIVGGQDMSGDPTKLRIGY